jgi:peptidoglycan/xylan/chitin deacetylase (PgdA/CDA1 family)
MRYLDDGRKAIALTIDDGPSPVYTRSIPRRFCACRRSIA